MDRHVLSGNTPRQQEVDATAAQAEVTATITPSLRPVQTTGEERLKIPVVQRDRSPRAVRPAVESRSIGGSRTPLMTLALVKLTYARLQGWMIDSV